MAVEDIALITSSLIISIVNSVPSQNLEGYVVKGDFADMREFPHAALLYIECVNTENVKQYFTCGSSILNQAIVITAAHCLENCFVKFAITVHVGNEELPFRASSFRIHEEYDSRSINNDIALIRLKKNLKFGKYVRRVSLMRNPPYHEPAKVTGWGFIDEEKQVIAKHLMQLRQRVWSRSSCILTMGKPIPVGTFCGGTMDSMSYVAPGDSGSGLMVRQYIQIGLVSFKNPSISRSLAIYTDVGHFYDWVKKTAKSRYHTLYLYMIRYVTDGLDKKLKYSVMSTCLHGPRKPFEGFVVEGACAKMEDFPHAALLYIECRESVHKPTQYFTCGSSILNQAMVLTAAHCLENCAAESTIVTVHVGDTKKKKGLPFKASGFKIHEKYDRKAVSNDIALVKLKKNLDFGKDVGRVALMKDPPYDEAAEVAGWGWLNENPRTESQFLMQASQKVWSRKNCIKTIGFIPEGTICGGALDALSYVAPGDSGSGLMVRKYIQIGIVSYKIPSKSARLAIYTDVAYFYEWIKKNTKRLHCN